MSSDAAPTSLPADPPAGEQSPWHEATPPSTSIHWRASRAFPSRDYREAGVQRLDSPPIYVAAVGGTLLAAACFGMSVVVVASLFGPPRLGEAVLFGLLAAVIGAFYAGLAAIVTFPAIAALQALAGLNAHATVLASMAGGWTGFLATIALVGREPAIRALPFVLGAMLYGQIGAGWAARAIGRRQLSASDCQVQVAQPRQFNLRQLLGLTAYVAVLAAVLANLPILPPTAALIGCGVGLQAVLIAAYFAIAPTRRRAVPRETTVANREI